MEGNQQYPEQQMDSLTQPDVTPQAATNQQPSVVYGDIQSPAPAAQVINPVVYSAQPEEIQSTPNMNVPDSTQGNYTNPSNPTSYSAANTTSSNGLKKILIIVGVILLIVIVGLTIFLLNKPKSNTANSTTSTINSSSSLKTTSESSASTNNLPTVSSPSTEYVSIAEYGIKYPKLAYQDKISYAVSPLSGMPNTPSDAKTIDFYYKETADTCPATGSSNIGSIWVTASSNSWKGAKKINDKYYLAVPVALLDGCKWSYTKGMTIPQEITNARKDLTDVIFNKLVAQ